MEVRSATCLIRLSANAVFIRRILPIKRSCTTDLIHPTSQVYRFTRFWQVGSIKQWLYFSYFFSPSQTAIDYRLAPETCFPGPLHDVVCAYLRLVEDLHIPPENIIICGDSAGGGLSLALLMYLRDNGYTLPSGAILLSPWVGECHGLLSSFVIINSVVVDLTMSCESWDSNAPYDVVPFPTADNHMNPIALYLGENIEMYLTHPYASPLFGDFKDLPPLLIQAGDAEVLRDEIILLAHKATLAGVQVRHELYEDAVSFLYIFLDLLLIWSSF